MPETEHIDEEERLGGVLTIQDIMGGDVVRQLNAAIQEVAKDIANLGKSGTDKRSIQLSMVFKPNEDRRRIDATADVKAKLGGRSANIAQLSLGIQDGELYMQEEEPDAREQSVQEVMRELAADGETMTISAGGNYVSFVNDGGVVRKVDGHAGH